ncbi:MAG: histidinol-phosphate transaminase [bacterium]
MNDLVAKHIQTLKPYQPGKPIEELERELGITNSIKLASNENPLGPSPKAVEAMTALVGQSHIYPDGAAYKLRARIAEKFGAQMNEVVIGNGSNELLTLLVRAFCLPEHNAVISDYSFVAYRVVLTAAGIPIKSVPVQEGFEQDLPAMAAACDANTRIVFLANPNNPTGTYANREQLAAFIRNVPAHVIVVIDEAYIEYAQAGDYAQALEFRDLRERLVVCRTFSKCYGLAGVRVGYAIGPAEMMDFVNRIREPFNCSLLGQAGALASLDDLEFVRRSVECNETGRRLLEAGLASMADLGVSWVPSQTNFLLVKFPENAMPIYDAMLRRGVIVRPMAPYGLSEYLRITIGTPSEVERCVAALRESITEVRA